MNIVSTGDLAQTFSLSRQNNAVRQQLDRLTQELTSGLVQDVTDRLKGDFSGLARSISGKDVDHLLKRGGARRVF